MTTLRHAARVRPLRVRPGARYTCFGDGLCCTDIHGLGPLNKKEVRALRVISDSVVAMPSTSGYDEPMLEVREDGGCLFLGVGRCELHAALGPEAKPDGCRRFPLGLTATPRGGRITTRHRCPCRTLGDRPPVDAESAVPALTDAAGRLSATQRIDGRVPIAGRSRVAFDTYEQIESDMLDRLAGGERPEHVLDASPFPTLRATSWEKVAEQMLSEADGSRFGVALSWFAESVLAHERDGYRRTTTARPWSDAFDRAEARSPTPASPSEMIADWIADSLWAMEWATEIGPLARTRAELATRLAIVRDVAKRIARTGARPDRATAEALTIADLVGDSEHWHELAPRFADC